MTTGIATDLAIDAEGVVKQFGPFRAVDGVDLRVPRGHVLALLGPNGAGKTTLTRLMAAVLNPSAGRVRIEGYDTVIAPNAVRAVVGLLTETPGLYERMSAFDYLDFYGRLRGIADAERLKRIQTLLDVFELTAHQHELVAKYSKGMRQKVALMRTLLHEPPVLFLDEPTSALDPRSAKIVREHIMALRRAGRTIVWCTHYLPEAEAMAETIAIVARGRIVAQGTRDELQRQLGSAARFRVELAGPVEPFLGCAAGLVEVEATGYTWLSFLTRDPRRTNPELIRRLTGAGAQIVALSERGTDLEDTYLRLVANHLGDV